MVHIIIPVHNRLSYTINCLDSIKLTVKDEHSVTVVDDGSTDGTSAYIRGNYPDVRIVRGDGDLFWTGSMKIGVESVLEGADSDDFIMSLNNDVILRDGSVEELLKEAKKCGKNLYGSLSLGIVDKDTIVPSGTIVKSWILNLTSHVYSSNSYRSLSDYSPVKVDILTGRSVLYPVEVFRAIGNFNAQDFPHYGGDDEFTIRANRLGWGLRLVPKSAVYIDQNATGLNPTIRLLSIKLLLLSIFSIRSTNNVIVRTKLAIKIAPWYAVPTYLCTSYLKIFFTISTSMLKLLYGKVNQ